MVMEEKPDAKANGEKRKTPRKSPYLFPAYNFAEARRIAETVENDGGGTLTEETLAINLRQSVKSSGFRLKALTARQFQLLTKQGENLIITPLAKAIFKPTDEGERREAMKQSFLAIPLFRAVANRFKGRELPQGEPFRNILEREFKIDNQRVSAAERVLLDSARDAGVLVTSGNKEYLSTDIQAMRPASQPPPSGNQGEQSGYAPNDYQPPAPRIQSQYGMPEISIADLALLNEKDYEAVWSALGKVFRVKGEQELKKQQESIRQVQVDEQEEISEEDN